MLKNLTNPDLVYKCGSNSEVQFYELSIMDRISREIVYQTKPFLNLKNCVDFKKDLFKTEVTGPSVLQQGVSYQFTISLERRADNLTFTPRTADKGLVFEPLQIVFLDYNDFNLTFLISVRPTAQEGNHTISFEKVEGPPGTENQYVPIIPFTVLVLPANNTNLPTPKVIISNLYVDTIGFPIIVPVKLTSKASNLMYL